MKPRFYLKKPNGKQKSFSVYKQFVLPDGTTRNEFVKYDDLTALNLQLKQNKLSVVEAKKVAERIRQRLNIDIGSTEIPETISQANEKVLDRYWKHEYTDRYIVDEYSARNKLECAIRALGDIDLNTSSKDEIARKIKESPKPINVKRMYIQKVNQLLRYLNRDIKLRMPKEERRDVHFLSDQEFAKALTFVTNKETEVMARIAFYVGARVGEIMTIDNTKIVTSKELLIDSQLDRKSKKSKRTKTGNIRRAYIFDQGVAAIKEWSQIKHKGINTISASKRFVQACKKAFPDQDDKHCSFHDLRHSYAGKIVSLTGSITYAAQCIGDSVQVTEKYYAGFMLRTESIELIDKLVRQNSVKI